MIVIHINRLYLTIQHGYQLLVMVLQLIRSHLPENSILFAKTGNFLSCFQFPQFLS